VPDEQTLPRLAGVAVRLAAGVMFADVFIPFATQGCTLCPIATPGKAFVLPSFSLIQGLDGWRVLLVVVALAFEAGAYLVRRRRTAAIASLVLAVIALALCIFEGVDSAGRVVGLDAQPRAVESGGTGVIEHTFTPPAHLIAGFYVFLAAALVAVIAAAAIVARTLRANRPGAVTYSPSISTT
jgi:hypothetical protein